MATRPEFRCYTDGSCKAAYGGAGGWGFHVRPPEGSPIEGFGSALDTLAKAMEFRAVAEALAILPSGACATVFSDSQSLVESLGKRLPSWRDAGFVKVDPWIVDSVRRIDEAIVGKRLDVRWQWVRGHAGNVGNERADALAAQGARNAKAMLAARAHREGLGAGERKAPMKPMKEASRRRRR